MPKRPSKGAQLQTLPSIDLPQLSFNLKAQDQFSTGLGVQFAHFAAMPSPIGMQDRGDYRRSGAIDNISSNGMLYRKVGCFTATLIGNSSTKNWSFGSTADDATARIVMPRFYDLGLEAAKGDRIRLATGDRLYLADPDADVYVVTYQKMEYNPTQYDRPQFPICKVQMLVDTNGIEYTQGKDFNITSDGNIAWVPGENNPGLNSETGKGNVYAIRYTYRAFWYISQLPNEIRITNITENGVRKPERMPYHAILLREYVYQNQLNAGLPAANPENQTNRTVSEPEQFAPDIQEIIVNASNK